MNLILKPVHIHLVLYSVLSFYETLIRNNINTEVFITVYDTFLLHCINPGENFFFLQILLSFFRECGTNIDKSAGRDKERNGSNSAPVLLCIWLCLYDSAASGNVSEVDFDLMLSLILPVSSVLSNFPDFQMWMFLKFIKSLKR